MNGLYFVFASVIEKVFQGLVGVVFTVVPAITVVTVAVVAVLLPHIQ